MNGILTEIDKLQEEINACRPLNKDLLEQIRQYYRVGLTYSSNAIEGNSLTESETKVVLEDGITIGGKPLKDHYETIGHAEAFDFLQSLIKEKSVSEEDIKNLHRIFYHRIDGMKAGQYRQVKVFLTGSKFPLPAPEEIPKLMKEFMRKIKELKDTKHPVEFSALAHKEFVFIHPFIDGNGRVTWLLMTLILLQAGYNTAIITPIMRQEYIQTLEKAHTDDKDFINLIARMVRETQKDYLRLFK